MIDPFDDGRHLSALPWRPNVMTYVRGRSGSHHTAGLVAAGGCV